MPWPTTTEYMEAVQSSFAFSDPELKQGTVSTTAPLRVTY